MPDGISTAPELKALLAEERAIWEQIQLAELVRTISDLTGVAQVYILAPGNDRSQRQQDARRIAMAMGRAWFGAPTDTRLATLFHTHSSIFAATRRRHAGLMETDAAYRHLTERVARQLKELRDRHPSPCPNP